MRKVLCAITLFCATALVHAEIPLEDPAQVQLKNMAQLAAVADSVSTHIALQAGAVESNPLVNTSVAGLIGLAAIKWGLIEWVDASALHTTQKTVIKRATASLWIGAAVNNLLIAVSAGPMALVGGVVAGTYIWLSSDIAKPPSTTTVD